MANALMKLEVDGPTWTRQSVQFKNWDAPGLAIVGEKLTTDAEMFREIAAQLRTIEGDGRARAATNASALETLAGQYEQAVRGESAQAR